MQLWKLWISYVSWLVLVHWLPSSVSVVWSSVGYLFVFFWHHSGIYTEDFIFFGTNRVRVFEDISFQYHSGLCTIQESSHLGNIFLVSIWFRMVLTQIITWIYIDSFIMRYPPNINIWLVLQFWYQSSMFSDTIIDIDYWHHVFTYISVWHWSEPQYLQI